MAFSALQTGKPALRFDFTTGSTESLGQVHIEILVVSDIEKDDTTLGSLDHVCSNGNKAQIHQDKLDYGKVR
ncbi:hypothetical protein FKW77_005805 [Venturia effusa]|uniref:Uncharacterized protein n=1 Tax=Venturia effusa TaxID=50376 RepID=A0A517LFJ7_9PEZI|nr:hypothetical protein FKW77_005805 [Venturia effusa]